jgi:phosphoglycerate dehydrogenase-like enzyme
MKHTERIQAGNRLRIFVDLALSPNVLDILHEGTAGHELVFPKIPVASVLAKGEPDPKFASVDIAFGQPDVKAIEEARNLKWIHVSSSGITRYDPPEFRALVAKRKIAVTNSATVYQEACAVHALSFILAQARQLPLGLKTQAANGSKAWYALRESVSTLRGETVLIVGYGAIGKRLAQLLRPFDVKIVAYRRKPARDEEISIITNEQLPHALSTADHVVDILPDSASTREFFDTKRFAMLKSGAVFYNIGRGTTVNQNALLGTLKSGHLKAAWLDVTDPEPLPHDHELLKQPTCFITPHIAGGHVEEAKTLVRHFLNNFERYIRGEPFIDRVM